MASSKGVRLLTLADREFRQLTEKRTVAKSDRKFKAIKLNAARFDSDWDRKRGAQYD